MNWVNGKLKPYKNSQSNKKASARQKIHRFIQNRIREEIDFSNSQYILEKKKRPSVLFDESFSNKLYSFNVDENDTLSLNILPDIYPEKKETHTAPKTSRFFQSQSAKKPESIPFADLKKTVYDFPSVPK